MCDDIEQQKCDESFNKNGYITIAQTVDKVSKAKKRRADSQQKPNTNNKVKC